MSTYTPSTAQSAFGLETYPVPGVGYRTSWVGLWLMCLGLVILLIGSFMPDLRTTVAGIPLNPVIFIIGAMSLLLCRASIASRVFLYTLPLTLCMVTLLWSANPSAGFHKGINFLVTTALSAILLGEAIAQLGLARFLKLVALLLLALLGGAVIHRSFTGFFVREGMFLMNGPIVFARLMGIAAIFSFFVFRGPVRWVLVILFFAAAVWTQSKGPVAALFGCVAILYLFRFWNWRSAALVLAVATICILVYVNRQSLEQVPVLKRYVIALDFNDPRNAGSIGLRQQRWREAGQAIAERPFLGAGLGGRDPIMLSGVEIPSDMMRGTYPHNLPLEVFSEMGLLLGAVFLIPFFLWLRDTNSALGATALFMLLASMVSGDLLDARYAAVFAMLTSLVVGLHRDAWLGR